MKKGFSGIKDVDLKIMMELDDSDLIKVCATNKELYRYCNEYPSFWRNRYVKQYGEMAAKHKPANRSWKDQYMQTYIDLHRFKNPIDFLSHIAWNGDVKTSFFVDYDRQKVMSLSQAPEWVMANLWLLKIPDIKVASFAPNALLIANYKEYKDVTPIELFQSIPILPNSYLLDFLRNGDQYVPIFVSREQVVFLFEDHEEI
jgi:hypothetical protein